MRTATENSRRRWLFDLKKFKKNLMGVASTSHLYARRLINSPEMCHTLTSDHRRYLSLHRSSMAHHVHTKCVYILKMNQLMSVERTSEVKSHRGTCGNTFTTRPVSCFPPNWLKVCERDSDCYCTSSWRNSVVCLWRRSNVGRLLGSSFQQSSIIW